jgi:two-component system nitrate/nitrite response regulator NarL
MVFLERIASKDPNLSSLTRKFKLTTRESQVVRLLAKGKSDKLIGHSLGLSIETVRGHMKHVRSKLGVTSRLEVVSLLAHVS